MRLLRSLWLPLSLMTVVLTTWAADEATRVDPEWERVQLETTVNERAKSVISAFTSGQQFIVQTSITLRPLQTGPSKALVKMEDASGNTTAEQEVFLSKLDMSAPVFEKLISNQGGPSDPEASVFARIQKVEIRASVPKFVLISGKDALQKQLTAVGKLTSKTPVTVAVEEWIAPPKAHEEDSWTIKQWIREFRASIGVVVGNLVVALFLFFIGWRLISAYRSLEGKKISLMEAANALEAEKSRAAAAEEEVAVETKDSHDSDEAYEIDGLDSGFERFGKLIVNDPEMASGLVRQWISGAEKNGPFEALLSLPQFIDPKALMNLFTYLTLSERKAWKTILSDRMTGPKGHEAKLADAFISKQIVDAIMMPAPVSDTEFKGLIQSLTFKDCFSLISNDISLAPVLINFLPTAIVSRIYALLPQEQADQITLLSVKLKESEIQEKLETLKSKVKDLASGKTVTSGTPFVENIAELLRTVSGEKEKSIWNALIEAREVGVIQAAALKVFPAHLLMKLKPTVLKQSIDRFSTAKKAEFIYLQADQNQKFFLELCGKEGSKIREMIEYELKQIPANELRKQKVMKQSAQLQQEYLENVRSLVATNESARECADEVVKQWIEQVVPGESLAQAA